MEFWVKFRYFYPLTLLKENKITWKFSQQSPLLSYEICLRIGKLSQLKMYDTSSKRIISKNFSAFSRKIHSLWWRQSRNFFFLLKLNFHEVSKYLFAFETSFWKVTNKALRRKIPWSEFWIFQKFEEPLASQSKWNTTDDLIFHIFICLMHKTPHNWQSNTCFSGAMICRHLFPRNF